MAPIIQPAGRRSRQRSLGPPAAAIAVLVVLGLFLAPFSAEAPLRCLGAKATVVGSDESNTLRGTPGPDVIHAGGGGDRIYGGGGDDRICGADGRDVIFGGPGRDYLHGGRGRDRLYGQRGSDALRGGPRGDRLFGGSGNDRLRGGGAVDHVDGGRGDDPLVSGGPGGFDVVVGGTGRDRVEGGPGRHDIDSYATTTASLLIDLRAGVVRGGEHEWLRGFEDALGGSGDDALIGSGAANRLDGGPGADRLQAVGASDVAFGGAGEDACIGGFSRQGSCDQAAAGSAVVVELARSIDASALVISGTDGSDQVALRRSRSRYLIGVSGSPVALGVAATCAYAGRRVIACPPHAARVQVAMGPGDDVLSLRGLPRGVDATLDGGPGSDRLIGGSGSDTLYAGDDGVADSLSGGRGDDQLLGVNVVHPREDSGGAIMRGGGGEDLMVGGQPCDGDRFVGGPGRNDSASFARARNPGVHVRAEIDGRVVDPGAGECRAGRISPSTEKIEGSPGPDRLFGDGSADVLLGRGGSDLLAGRGGEDRCIGGGGRDRFGSCEERFR
jgi:Ca2+-binding RTX toxin-like protein